MNRRKLLELATMTASGTLLPRVAEARQRTRVLRFAHLTDVHIEAAKVRSPGGFARALQTLEELPDRPTFILNGGDAIFDGLARDRDDTASQWRLWHDVVRNGTALPFVHCIGNHDIWGWRWRDDPRIAGDAHFGKAWALEELGMASPWHASMHDGWKLIVLDSTHMHPTGYMGLLGEEQFAWLEAELEATSADTPIIVASHIPIVTFAAHIWFGDEPSDTELAIIRRNLVHSDAVRLKNLFRGHPGVRMCLSGHLHMQERIEYLGVTYVCSGAVSGNWWNVEAPAFHEFGPAVALVDCYDDGTVEHTMIQLG